MAPALPKKGGETARLSSPPVRDSEENGREEEKVIMKALKQALATLVAICTLTAGALALGDGQRQGEQKPPPKPPQKIEPEKKPPPPPRGDKGGGNDNKRGKP